MNNIILGILLISVLVLAGCSSQTVVKYQCVDGSFVDSADLCPKSDTQTNCPELDCSACGVEIQTKEIIKYQCADGTIKESISNCPQIQAESKKTTSSDFNLDDHRSNNANVIESQKASVSKIVFNSGILEIEYTSRWAGEDMAVREEFDIFKAITEEVKNNKGISKIKVSTVASMGSIYSVELSFEDSLKTINYEMGFEDWKTYVRG